jgi:hypothetical protein
MTAAAAAAGGFAQWVRFERARLVAESLIQMS